MLITIAVVAVLVLVAVALLARRRRSGGVLVVGSAEGHGHEEEAPDPSRLLGASAVMGSPVVSTRSGERLARVKDVVYSPADGRVEGFTLLPARRWWRGPMRQVLPAAKLGEVGPDAVVVEGTESLVDRAQVPALATVGAERNVLGGRVITETGKDVGQVVDVVVRLGTRPAAIGYEIQRPGGGRHRFIPLSEQRGVSGDALVVPADVETLLRDDLVGYGAAVTKLRGRRRRGSSR